MNRKIVITDFDGTLLNDNRQITQANLDMLDRLRHNGITVAIATGRSLASFEGALADMALDRPVLSLSIDYVIFSTGAGVMDFSTREILFERSLSSDDAAKVAHHFDRLQIDYMIHKSIPDTHHLLHKSFHRDNADFHKRLSMYNTHAVPLGTFNGQFEYITEVLAILPNHNGGKTVSKIQADLPGFSVIPATSPLDHRSLWIEVFHRDVSKSKTAAWLCGRLDIDRDNVTAIGNDYNDKDLLLWAKRGIVVENAPDRLKSMFTVVACNNSSGFAMAVKDIGT